MLHHTNIIPIFIRHFACAYHRVREQFESPYPSNSLMHWNLTLDHYDRFQIKSSGASTLPFSLMLLGKPINLSIFGRRWSRTQHIAMLRNITPMLQLCRQYLFNANFVHALSQGFANQPDYVNVFARDYGIDSEGSIAFDLGRFLLHRHFSIRLPYTMHRCFE